jgi:hypothetical protein
MNALSALSRGAASRSPQDAQILEATIRSAPESLSDPVYVTVDAQSRTRRRGPCKGWQPRPDDTWPSPGDTAVVAETNEGTLWVLQWWPADG